jgi:hypothetical protein
MTEERDSSRPDAGAPFFSIVIAAYNTGSRILPTIHSILSQTYREFEILVIGDGCTDATGEILATNFADAVHWENLDRNHGSQSYPNNTGIERARGTHIAYMEHDDVWTRRHLEKLAAVIRASDPDFAVSGAVYHAPSGSKYYQFTGIFDDPAAAATEFFPSSSFAHRRDVTDRIGPWRDAADARAPVDCEFLLRASSSGCSFVSTKATTVHKFAAAHRYLSYRFPSAQEQERMLERLLRPDGDAEVLREIEADIAAGADHPPIRYPDFSRYSPGQLHRDARQTKGLDQPPLTDVAQTLRIAPVSTHAALDWYPPEVHPVYGRFRWSGPNPNPIYWLPVRIHGAFHLRIHVIAFADAGLIRTLAIELNDAPAALTVEPVDDGTYVLTARPRSNHPIRDGLKIKFRMPYSTRPRDDPFQRRIGIALGTIRIVRTP